MCFSSGSSSPAQVTTQTVAPAAPAPMKAAQPAQIGLARKAENRAHFGSSSGPTTRVPRASETSGPNTNYRM